MDTETGTSIIWLPVTPGVDAGVRDPNIGAETILASRIQEHSVVTVLLPLYDRGRPIEVRAQDRLAVTTTDPVTGDATTVVVSVTGVLGRFSEWPVVQRVVAEVRD